MKLRSAVFLLYVMIMRLHELIRYRWGYGQGARELSQLLEM